MKKIKARQLVFIVIILIFLGGSGFMIFMNHKMKQLSSMTPQEMIEYTNKDRSDAAISIGIITGDTVTITVYGEDGVIIDDDSSVYEIGSITKTFTGALLCKAQTEGRIALDDTIDQYIETDIKKDYPTIKSLATHTSGYKNYYFNTQMIKNKIEGRKNDYYGIDAKRQSAVLSKSKNPGTFKYSNFGIGVLGTVLSEVYQKPYAELMNNFISSELGLPNTRLSFEDKSQEGFWEWHSEDVYLSSGGITSTIEDMTTYLRLQMSGTLACLEQGQRVYHKVSHPNRRLETMNIRTDAVGLTWMIDEMNGFYWHNGGTSAFNSYIAFDTNSNIGIVILSNASPKYRIPATVMGPKLMMEQRLLKIAKGTSRYE